MRGGVMLTHLVASTHHHRQQLASLDDAAAELAPDMGEERAESKDQRAAPDRFWLLESARRAARDRRRR